MARPLNTKQRRFIAEYLIDSNGTQAAIRAGYSKKTAAEIAYELLRKPQIRAAIEKPLMRREMSAEQVIEELSDIARRPTPKRVKVKEKIRALELLAKKHGLIKERHSVENPDGTPLNLAALSPAQLEALEKLLEIATPAVPKG